MAAVVRGAVRSLLTGPRGGRLKFPARDGHSTGKTALTGRESDPTKLSARDPQTGQFVAQSDQFDDIEVATFSATVGVPAADLDGSTTFNGGNSESFEGVELIDYDEIVDRNEELVLLSAHHRMSAMINSTETADGSMRAAVEISADPSRTGVTLRASRQNGEDIEGSDVFDGTSEMDDSIDLVGRPLAATAHAPHSDGATGTGGGGSAGEDTYELTMAPAEFGRFHPRDELFLNGFVAVDNVDDSGVHVTTVGQHVYGVLGD